MSEVKCPYCDAKTEINHDDGYGYEENQIHEQQCWNCDRNFGFKTEVSFYYETLKVPCFNGGEHDLKEIHGYPKAFFVGKKRCQSCGETITVDEDAHDRAMLDYVSEKK